MFSTSATERPRTTDPRCALECQLSHLEVTSTEIVDMLWLRTTDLSDCLELSRLGQDIANAAVSLEKARRRLERMDTRRPL